MKALHSRNGNVLRGQLKEPSQKRKPAMKRVRFDTLVARYYPAVYIFASRLTDDPREAVLLTRAAFNSTRKQLRSRRDEVRLVTILLNGVIRAGLAALEPGSRNPRLQRPGCDAKENAVSFQRAMGRASGCSLCFRSS